MVIEQVFQALADGNRRHLLDLLSQSDGQTLTQLSAHLPMTRFGAMKHLRVLEDAGLITTRKVGREKRHYLNAVPLVGVATWADKYRRLWEARLDALDDFLKDQQEEQNNEPE
jgi:DNA-binding transcriptional ArsR family regulator